MIPLNFENPKKLAISILQRMCEADYTPSSPEMGVCGNFLDMVLLEEDDQTECDCTDGALDVFNHHLQSYCKTHSLHQGYPIEGAYAYYQLNDHKWGGEWLEKRRDLMRGLITQIERTL